MTSFVSLEDSLPVKITLSSKDNLFTSCSKPPRDGPSPTITSLNSGALFRTLCSASISVSIFLIGERTATVQIYLLNLTFSSDKYMDRSEYVGNTKYFLLGYLF